MATIDDRHLIDQLIASGGYYEDDPRAELIVEYITPEGRTVWGVTWSHETPQRQLRYLDETAFVRAPRIIWSAQGGVQAAPPQTLTYRRRARKGTDHTADGVIYVHHFGTGWQELVFADHASAARFAAANGATLSAPEGGAQ